MSHNGRMLTKQELAARLLKVNVEEVAALADVSEKTVYRLRNMATNPTYATASRLIDACDAIERRDRAARKRKPRTASPAQRDAKERA